MALPPTLMIVTASIPPSHEADWNRWYDDVHLPEIVDCPGFRSGQRYVSEKDGVRSYVAIYELDGPAVLQSPEFAARRGWGPFVDQVEFQTRIFSRIAQITKP